ncbi:MAG: hypothetical protein K0R14_2011 [Burkholderiales bacterium]|jgi:hypothetical protein|nr:hypothetical protein [Burkholderiales bacterium]
MKPVFLFLSAILSFYASAATLSENDPVCSREYQSAVTYYSYLIDIPTLGLSGILAPIHKDMCPDIAERVDQIDNHLNNIEGKLEKISDNLTQIQVSLKNHGYDMLSFQSEIYDTQVQEYLEKYQHNLDKFNRYVSDYRLIYAPKSSLKDYSISAHDDKGNKLGFVHLYGDDFKFADKISGTREFINLLKDIIIIPKSGDTPVIMTYLNKLCRNTKDIDGDVIERRNKCNTLITGIIADISSAVGSTEAILGDEIDTVVLAQNNKNITDAWLGSATGRTLGLFNGDIRWGAARSKLYPITQGYLDAIKNLFMGPSSSKMFPLFEGFPADKYDMINRVCSNPKTHLPGIIKWYPNPRYPAEPFVITECLSNQKDPNSKVRSLVYYKKITKLDNILGVLINHDAKKSTWSRLNISNPLNTTIAGCYECFLAYPGIKDALGQTLAKFRLNSNTPLEINSVTVTTKTSGQNLTQANVPDVSFVQSGQYYAVSPAYSYKPATGNREIFVNQTNVKSNTVMTSTLLHPVLNTNNSLSKTSFYSEVYNNSFSINGTIYYPNLSATIYLSFKAEGFQPKGDYYIIDKDTTYVFGINIFNANGGQIGNFGQYENLALVCFDTFKCLGKVSGSPRTNENRFGGKNIIQWYNGVSVEMTGDNNGNVTLKVNPKVDPTKNEDKNEQLKKEIADTNAML